MVNEEVETPVQLGECDEKAEKWVVQVDSLQCGLELRQTCSQSEHYKMWMMKFEGLIMG